MREQNGAGEESFPVKHPGVATGYGQQGEQRTSKTPVSQSRDRLPRLKKTAIIILLIVILVATSALVAWLTYWIGY
ncbi:MAG: hypothetical protein BWY25_01318 [Chloroflexi bacterium ADurb.Bin222]|nr:MAG: hypothetical protein BWY25_01318 [Chloroflexi bacterium ADurb.Bin222]HQJ10433.1 hypothetical protein [Anaerolineae bacterium]